MKKRLLKLCSIVLALVMIFHMLPLQVLADTLSTEEMGIPSDPVFSEEIKPDTASLDVIEEVTENRTEYSKEFKMSNGLHMAAVYGSAVHYDDNGTWKEIDNTLVAAVAGTDAVYTNTAGVWNISFPQQLSSENYISVTKDGYTLRFGMAGALTNNGAVVMSGAADISATEQINSGVLTVQEAQTVTAQVQQQDTAAIRAEAEHPETVATKMNSRLQYSNVYPNTHLVYDLQSNMLKESVLISRYDSDLRGYRYILDVGTMIPILKEDNSIWFYDNTQTEVIMVMPAPYLLDAENGFSDDVEVVLESSGGTYTLLYLLPADWLAAEDRVWPVVLDPVIAAETTPSNVRDTIVAEGAEVSYLFPTNCCGYELGWGIHRFYVKYDNLPNISSADVIVSASFRMYKEMTSTTTDPVEVHKVNATWESQGLTWSNMPGYNEEVEDFVMSCAAGNYYWDITDIVRGWYEGENTGMMFKSPDSVEAAQVRNFEEFRSSDYNYSDIPELAIYFRNSIGLEGYWDYTASSAGRAGTGYVNNYSGNLVWVHNDLGFGGNRMPVSISHIYNISESHLNLLGFGYGWRTNFNQFVYRWSENSNYYVWEDANGTVHYFLYSSYGTYKDEDGLGLTLTNTGSGTTKYCITDKSGNKSYFDTYGRLTKQQNNQATPSSIEINYTTGSGYLISSVTDGAGRKYNFTYSGGLLSRISYTGTGTSEISYVTFGYTGSNLTSITYKDGETVEYGYTGHLLTSAKDIDGYRLTYSYASSATTGKPHRVLSIAESDDGVAGGSLSIAYDHNQTTFTDQNDNQQIIQFNNWGNTVAIQDGEGHAQYAQYATDTDPNTGKSNQLRLASKLQNTVANLLPDNSFELGTAWSASGATVSNAAGTAYYGSKALKIVTSAAGGAKTTFTAEPGKTYTFSAYVKTGSSAAYLTLGGTSGETLAADSGWTRLEVSYTNETGSSQTVTAQIMNTAAGTTYMDCVQLEAAPTASRYNLIVNGDFRDATAWSSSNGRTTATAAAPQLSTNVYKLTGTYTSANRISQTVNVSGSKGDTFVLAGWAKGNAAPCTPFTGSNYVCSDRKFALVAVFNYADGNASDEIPISFNPDVDNWQYAAAPIVAPEDYTSVTVYLAYDHNANDVYFDGIQLYKEQFGNSYTYDEDGNVVSAVDLQKQKTTYIYDETTQDLLQILQGEERTAGSVKMTYTYDSYHNVLSATTPEGLAYGFTYDIYGNNTSVSVRNGDTVMTSFAEYTDDGNRLYRTIDAAGNVTTYNYDVNTNVLRWVQYPNDTEDTWMGYGYDEMYRMIQAKVHLDNSALTASYTYENDLLTQIDTASTTYTFEYGNFALRSAVKVGDCELAAYSYESGTHYLFSLDYGNGDRVQYTYDNLGRIIAETWEDGDTVTYAYDNDGALATVTDSVTGLTTTYYYDFVGRNAATRSERSSSLHTYDDEGRLTRLDYRTPTTGAIFERFVYDADEDNAIADGTLLYMKMNSSNYLNYRYDALQRVTDKYIERDVNVDRQIWERFHYTDSYVSQKEVWIGNTYTHKLHYTYDGNGNITSVSDDIGGTAVTYTYDKANQLTGAVYSDGREEAYTYDNAGNLLTFNNGSGTHTYTYGDSDWGDLLTAVDGQTITYDAVGNPLSYYDGYRYTFTWEHGRQLQSVTYLGSTTTYEYDQNGIRTKKTRADGRYTVYAVVDGRAVGETRYTASGAIELYIRYIFDESGVVNGIGLWYPGDSAWTDYYFAKNLQGDVLAVYDSSHNCVATYSYDSWGNILTKSGSLADINPFRYRTYYYDNETWFYYLESRYYDPAIGRFINADVFVSTGQGVLGNNMFAYCGNNPIIRVDYSGESFAILLGFNFNLFGWGFIGTINLVSTEENFGVQYSYYLSDDAEISEKENQTVCVDVGPYIGVQYTDKESMEELEGYARATGGDLFLGGDVLTEEDGDYLGWQFGASAFSLNMHSLYTNTETLVSIPTFDLFDMLVDWIFGEG